MQRDHFNQQHQYDNTLDKATVVNAECSFGSEKYPDGGKNWNCAIDKCSQAYREIVSFFRPSAKDNFFTTIYCTKKFITSIFYPDGNPG